jgi:hypothetical protein
MPEVVVDTSPIQYLYQIDRIDLLELGNPCQVSG